MREDKISKDKRQNRETVGPGRRHKAEELPPGGKGDGKSGSNDEKRHQDQEAAGATLEERDLGGPDNIDDESLGAKGF